MPSSRVLLLGPAPSRMPPTQALEMLRPAELPKLTKLPRLTKCVLTNTKFATGKAAKTFNIEANYEPEPVQLQTLAGWSGLKERSAEQLADGLVLFALRAVIDRDGPFGYVILQRQAADLSQRWPALEEEIGEHLYTDLGDGNTLLNLRGPGGSAFVDALWELHLTGAVYCFDDYSLAATLAVAAQAVELNG
ncbi:MAG: hypothetical protein H0W39_03170 [Sphingomonas sp.]|nr:hypothetical protein [Sphingomonas sp.]